MGSVEGGSAGMTSRPWVTRVGFGLAAGAATAAVDNVLFDGEVNPIVIVAMLLAATITFGIVFGRLGWVAAGATWIWIPGAHVVKRIFDLPDTLHPNTYGSIGKLALFSLVVAAVGLGCGLLARRSGRGPRSGAAAANH